MAMLLAVFSFAASPSRVPVQNSAIGKIAPWVLEKTAGGKQAEFLVVLADQADVSGAKALKTKQEKGRYVRDNLWNKAQATQAPLLQWLRVRNIEHRSYYIVNLIWVKAGIDVAQTLAARPDVLRIEGNPQIHNKLPGPGATSSSPAQPQATETVESGISYTRAPQVWAQGFTGQGVVVGGADTGYQWDHPALINHYRGWNGSTADHNYNWHDSIHSGNSSCGINLTHPCDGFGHGTHTMGTAIGDDGSGNQIGMAPGAKWIGCRNMNDQGNGTPTTYLECFEFFLAPYPFTGGPGNGDPSKAPDVTTNSWDCPVSEGCTSANTLQNGVEAQRAAGIEMVVAAGNSGSNCSTISAPPSFYQGVYTVGALDTGADTIASFSSRGPVTADGSNRLKPDLSAPGNPVRSAWPTNSYNTISGTSMATPHVAGAVALLLSAQPALRHDPTTIEILLSQTAVPIPSSTCDGGGPLLSPNNTFGHGRLDIKAAVDAALLRPLSITRSGNNIVVSFFAVAGKTYRLERKIDNVDATWQTVSNLTPASTGLTQITDPNAVSLGKALYRVRLLP